MNTKCSASGTRVTIPVKTEFRSVGFSVEATLTGKIDRNYTLARLREISSSWPRLPGESAIYVEVFAKGLGVRVGESTTYLPAEAVFDERTGDPISEMIDRFSWNEISSDPSDGHPTLAEANETSRRAWKNSGVAL